MKFETVQRGLRLAGGVATVVSVGTIVQGLRRSSKHEVGKGGGRLLTLLHSPTALAASSVAGVAVLGAMWRPLPLKLPRGAEIAATVAGSGMFLAGVGLFHWGRRTMADMYDVSTSQSVQLYADHRLVTNGPFAYVRHPLYVAGTLAEIGALLLYRNWAVAMVALNVLSLVGRSRREEAVLAEEFGEQWTAYTSRVPAWIPRVS